MFKKTGFLLLAGVLGLALVALPGCGAGSDRSVSVPLKSLPVQYGGRVQPFDTFARNSLRLIYGKTHYNQKPARDIVLSWALIPGFWNHQDFIHIPEAAVKKSLNLNRRQQWFSPYKLLNHQTFRNQLQQLNTMRQNKLSLSSYFRFVEKLESRLALFQAIARGQVPGFIPPRVKDFKEEGEWIPAFAGMTKPAGMTDKGMTKSLKGMTKPVGVKGFSGGIKESDAEAKKSSQGVDAPQGSSAASRGVPKSAGMTDSSVNGAPSAGKTDSLKGNVANKNPPSLPDPLSVKKAQSTHLYMHEAHKALGRIITTYVEALAYLTPSSSLLVSQAVQDFKNIFKNHNPGYEGHLSRMGMEIHYNTLNPFRVSWILYLVGLLLLLINRLPILGLLRGRRFNFLYFGIKGGLSLLAVPAVFVAFLVQGYGMLLRCLIMGRPPVTNMYETVIWVPWVAVILGTLLWKTQKFFAAFVCGAILSLLCLLLSDQAPTLLDGSLQPLEAVLRSNFWLSTHVLVITMSYGAFFLAFVLGDVGLFFFLTQKKLPFVYIRSIDRCIQVGVVLLAAGTVLGGIWADYSWGRFWGWDPKETWALISLLGYLALLHGRLAGWLKEFGLVAGAVGMFFLIVMAWYGVNYVLGQGLHSYGFGAGGGGICECFCLGSPDIYRTGLDL